MTPNAPARIAAILAADPICAGRVTSETVDTLAAMVCPKPAGEDVERVARAMAENEGWRWGQRDGPPNMVNEAWSGQATSRARSTWRNRARAAIAALHPTDDLRRTREAVELLRETEKLFPTDLRCHRGLRNRVSTFLSTVSKEREHG